MKRKITAVVLILIVSIGVKAQTKQQKANSNLILDSGFYTHALMTNNRHADTAQCYFLKVPAHVEFPLQAIGAQWFLGYSVLKFNEIKATYLYLDKSPVLEQVLISIPKQ